MIGILVSLQRLKLFEKLILIGPSPCYIDQDDYNGGVSKEDIEDLIDALENNYLGWSSPFTPVSAGHP